MSKGITFDDDRDMVNKRIAKLAHEAFSQAYKEALESEDGVVAAEDGVLYQVFKDGRKIKIKDLPPRIKIDPKKTYTLRA